MKSYRDKLRDPRWQKKRLQVLERDEWKCCMCQDSTQNLQVHHKHYRPKTEPWEYESFELVTLCEECHLCVEDMIRKLSWWLPNQDLFFTFCRIQQILTTNHQKEFSDLILTCVNNPDHIREMLDLYSKAHPITDAELQESL